MPGKLGLSFVTVVGACATLVLAACGGSTQTPLVPRADSGIEAPEAVPYDVAPRLVNAPEVEEQLRQSYPPKLREQGISGSAVVFIFIDRYGQVTEVRPRTRSSRTEFNRAAESVVRAMRFEPAKADGEPVGIWTIQEVSFSAR